MSSCLTCKLAAWDTTSNGRLHPNGQGRCQWVMPPLPVLPAAFYFIGGMPRPSGGFISRKRPCEDCPAWEPKK